MESQVTGSYQAGHGPRYEIDIEGTIRPWGAPTITVPQIRTLGGIPAGMPVEEIDLRTNEQRTLAEDEVIELQPGMGYSKKIEFRRG